MKSYRYIFADCAYCNASTFFFRKHENLRSFIHPHSSTKTHVKIHHSDLDLDYSQEMISEEDDFNPLQNSSSESHVEFTTEMERRLLNVKEVCSRYHQTYDGRQVKLILNVQVTIKP